MSDFIIKEETFPTYITTTLPYANSVPHVGHALEFFQADAYSRYFRFKNGPKSVHFNLGVDEHGLKVFETTKNNKQGPKEYLDQLIPKWKNFCDIFDISFDSFYRTSSDEHHKGAREFWKKCHHAGDIYSKYYEGLYCVGCESFLLERDLIDHKCPDHGTEPVVFSEENYFFRLSKYRTALKEYIEANPSFLKPASKKKELLNFISEMEDISISRSRENLPWGVEVPDDPNHIMYVWFDALTNYINAVGFNKNIKNFNSWWPGIQICGPDNLRFQGAIWQGMLSSIGIPLTKKLLVHGTIYGPDSQKMSKTLGNVIDPCDQQEKFGSDACRFYLLGVLRTYADSTYREEDLISAYNTYLANNFGNLLNRLIHLANKHSINLLQEDQVESDFLKEVSDFSAKAKKAYEEFELHDAVSAVNDLVSYGNKYFHKQEPWKQGRKDIAITLNNVSILLKVASQFYEPVIPKGAKKALEILSSKENTILFPKIS